MKILAILFWISLFLIFYSYLGYGLLLWALIRIKRVFRGKTNPQNPEQWPTVTLLVAAFNEEEDIQTKIFNSLTLHYPEDRIKYLFVTDGSSDRTPEIVARFPQIQHLHRPERQGKLAAVERAMQLVDTDMVVFTDANTILNPDAITNMLRHFTNPQVGAVAGEKRVISKEEDAAAGAGEGFYWRYEGTLKRWDAELHTVVGAAGELFAIRTELYEEVPRDTIIEDFFLTLRIAQKGYRVMYEPGACAEELPSANSGEELKRKIRIAAGGIQSIVRLKPLLNPFRYGWLSFQYVSHRVLRWSLAPMALLVVLVTNMALALEGSFFYQLLLAGQLLFYASALLGYVLESRRLRLKAFFIPYYFFMMNYAVYAGFWRYLHGSQSAVWERAKRQAA
ncbi:glycosyltransferase family 2 protein [Cesiribacter andamanensis]|uniref:Glucans biosynthesis glucosyltransferase H n=1 Tax=Cesiribacter andamanensis AMV16 TaxID=1279009 RepID=M7P235_9BACT|nr:glycosyltransferase family 2 protein [Cesiribacter andamanensis]EMR04639.1 Poly-beta-1,6-N-acetyl-D-glucosamine synthase [Cesiribacter andamanensis AMV16]